MKNTAFDIDLDFGTTAEAKVERLLQSKGKIEVKTERHQWVDTGNIAIEVKYRDKPSGLFLTKADWWFHTLTDGISFLLAVPVFRDIVRKLVKNKQVRVVKGGDNNWSTLVLIPLPVLMSAIRAHASEAYPANLQANELASNS